MRTAMLRAALAALALGPVALGLSACGSAHSSGAAPLAPAAASSSVPPAASSSSPAPSVTPSRTVLASPVVDVQPLHQLVLPDLLVVGHGALSPAETAAIRAVTGVTSTLAVSAGSVTLPHGPVTALGVDPSTFRAYTPARTASSDALWQSVARGEMLTTFDVATAQKETLGANVWVSGVLTRFGSFADLQMPGIGAVVTSSLATKLKLSPNAGLLVSAPSRDIVGLRTQVAKLVPGAVVVMLRPVLAGGHATMGKDLYERAAKTCPGLPWTVLAAIGGIESDHGANTGVSSAGAEGPMQFLPTTWAQFATDGDGDGVANIDDPADAVFSAAKMLCHDDAEAGGTALRNAIFSYNHADWYVDAVLQLSTIYSRDD